MCMTSDIVDEKRLLELLPLTHWQLQRLRKRRKIPFIRVGYCTLRYDVADVTAALRPNSLP